MARVLVIDDSQSVYLHVRGILMPHGHIVDRLGVFTELPRYMRETPPDLVLLDLEMPALSGCAFAKFIRAVEKFNTPIIVHSSVERNALRSAADEIGAVAVAPKGITDARLVDVVRAALSSQEPARAGS